MLNKQKKITVLLDQQEFDKFDQFCREQGFKKSTLLVRLLKEFLAREARAQVNSEQHFNRPQKRR